MSNNHINFNDYNLSAEIGEGIYAFDKPKGFSSNLLLTYIKKKTGIKKVGHAGTLDPLATGVLVVALGKKYTKQLNNIVKTEKEYIAKIRLGAVSETDDAEGPIIESKVDKVPTKDEIEHAVKKFIGSIEQIPPVYSAIKISGQEAYKRVRKGESLEMKSRVVLINKIELLSYKWPYLELRVTTGPGVYIRSLARDIGDKLGVGGYIDELRRTRVGEFDIQNSIKIENVT